MSNIYLTVCNKKSSVNATGKAQQQCMFESPVKQNQLPEGARRPAAINLHGVS